jgi:hypothetical protein
MTAIEGHAPGDAQAQTIQHLVWRNWKEEDQVQEQCCANIFNWWIGSSTCSKCLLMILTEAELSRLGMSTIATVFAVLIVS